ncbi:MAG: cytochrome c oxidase subunit II [Planctomycetes bacterium]|nr:cytochrome c oxidase subunit II [Planctomycetota bacterium]
MPEQASTFAENVDWLFYGILYICIFFFVLVTALTVYFVVKYRRKSPMQETGGPTHNWFLEITWCAIPLAIVGWMWFEGFRGFMEMRSSPKGADALRVIVNAQKWSWDFTYPNGAMTQDLHVPANHKVVLSLNSLDVLHSFYVNTFRTKMDVVPGRINEIWFEPTMAGEFTLQCAEYCGDEHSRMRSKVIVHEDKAAFDTWLESYDPYKGLEPIAAGKLVFESKGCTQCHNVTGTNQIGPTLKGVIGREREFADGTKMVTDANYVRESVLDSKAKVVKGFDPVMPNYKGRISDKEIGFLIEYLTEVSKN